MGRDRRPAHTKPTKQRPGTFYKAYEGQVTLYGTSYRAVVVHSSAQDKRRQQRLARDSRHLIAHIVVCGPLSNGSIFAAPMRTPRRAAPRHAPRLPCGGGHCRGTARVWPRPAQPQKPRPIKTMRYRLQATIRPHTERIGQRRKKLGCFVLLTNVPQPETWLIASVTSHRIQRPTWDRANYGFSKIP